jgi:hypothetical protein
MQSGLVILRLSGETLFRWELDVVSAWAVISLCSAVPDVGTRILEYFLAGVNDLERLAGFDEKWRNSFDLLRVEDVSGARLLGTAVEQFERETKDLCAYRDKPLQFVTAHEHKD